MVTVVWSKPNSGQIFHQRPLAPPFVSSFSLHAFKKQAKQSKFDLRVLVEVFYEGISNFQTFVVQKQPQVDVSLQNSLKDIFPPTLCS